MPFPRSCLFLPSDVVYGFASVLQHIKKNYHGNMNVCASVVKESHTAGNSR
ncbi:TPA: hypothetical protein G9A96_001329 [Salmonella enterica]|uniref:Uncharacterized protein n=1 Tax=Salmonella enterica TaxID=28901 RepID=A0A747TZF7_SALER|nr:hypothetical protein [Salmonella enterica]